MPFPGGFSLFVRVEEIKISLDKIGLWSYKKSVFGAIYIFINTSWRITQMCASEEFVMKENLIAKRLQGLSKIIIIGGCVFGVLAIILYDGIVGCVVTVSASFAATLLEGFAEVVELLHKSHKTQEEILAQLSKQPTTKSVLEDIESNLPQI